MTIEAHKAIVQRFFLEVLKDGKLEVLHEIMTPDCSYTDGGMLKFQTRDDFASYVREARDKFTNIKITIDDIIAEGNKVAVRCAYHLESARGRYVTPVMGIFHFQENRIAEIWRNIAASDDTESSS